MVRSPVIFLFAYLTFLAFLKQTRTKYFKILKKLLSLLSYDNYTVTLILYFHISLRDKTLVLPSMCPLELHQAYRQKETLISWVMKFFSLVLPVLVGRSSDQKWAVVYYEGASCQGEGWGESAAEPQRLKRQESALPTQAQVTFVKCYVTGNNLQWEQRLLPEVPHPLMVDAMNTR